MATFALITREYVVVRGCVEHFTGDSGVQPSTSPVCELATSTTPVIVDTELVATPYTGWYICTDKHCNSLAANFDTASSNKDWKRDNLPCPEPTNSESLKVWSISF